MNDQLEICLQKIQALELALRRINSNAARSTQQLFEYNNHRKSYVARKYGRSGDATKSQGRAPGRAMGELV